MVRFREILKGTIFEHRINLLIEDSKNKWLRDLGKNDFIHSNSVENNLDRFIPDELKTNENIFDKAEIFLLLYAVYLHDIGRKVSVDQHEQETYNQILKNPEKYGLKNKFEAYAVAEICYGHANESEKPIKSIRPNYGIADLSDKPLNLRFLAALLRLADEVDNAYTRVQGIKSEDGSKRNLIRFINFDTSRWIIEFQSEPVSWKDWSELQKIRSYTQKRLDEIKDILELKGLLYYQIWLDPKDLQEIPESKQKDTESERVIDHEISSKDKMSKKGSYSLVEYEYDVALSFAGEDRNYVETVARLLIAKKVDVFYDRFEEASLWGKNLYTHLDQVYRSKARYCVLFLSKHYATKAWTNHERESAQSRAFQEQEDYILPARFDNTEIPGIRPTIGYIDLRTKTPEQLADLILEKLEKDLKNAFEKLSSEFTEKTRRNGMNLTERILTVNRLEQIGSKINDFNFLIDKLKNGNEGERVGAAVSLKILLKKEAFNDLLSNSSYTEKGGSFVRYRAVEALNALLKANKLDSEEIEKLKSVLNQQYLKEENRIVKQNIIKVLTLLK